MSAPDYRQALTDQLIEQLENGTAPWQKPWDSSLGTMRLPFNPTTGNPYRGINSINLAMTGAFKGYEDPRWLTYKQAEAKGWFVKAGEKGTLVEYWKFTERRPELDENGRQKVDAHGEKQYIEVRLEKPRRFTAWVFNAQQMENVPKLEQPQYDWNVADKAERILANSGAVILHDQMDRAFYSPAKDEIHLPGREQFPDQMAYYSTALHELGHWTGHESRLGRDLSGRFGSADYAKEELRAELTSLFLADRLGVPHSIGQHASYVKSWIKALQEDKNEIFRAARDAEKMTEYVLGLDLEKEQQRVKETGIDGADEVPAPSVGKVYLNVPYKERNEAKQLGAKWDKEAKQWYVPDNANLDAFAKWRQPAPEVSHAKETAPAPSLEVPDTTNTKNLKIYLNVPFKDKDAVKQLGARWDKEAKLWYAPENADLAQFTQWRQPPTQARSITQDPQLEFGDALRAAGLILDGPPIMNGKWQRVPVEDADQGKKDGAYKGYLDGTPNGVYENHRTGEQGRWKQEGVQLTPEQRAALIAEAAINKQMRAAELSAQHETVAKAAVARWESLPDAPAAPNAYLERKQVPDYGVKFDGDNLVVPARDVNGKIWSLQTIPPESGGIKKFMKDGRKEGNMHIIGQIEAGQPILVVEGYATGASVHLATKLPVVVAFDSGNLEAVVGALNSRYETTPKFILADDDKEQKRNVGVGKALAAGFAHDVGVGFPTFATEGKKTDFNDLHVTEGLATVAQQVHGVISQTMQQSWEKAAEIARQHLGVDVHVSQPAQQHTGEILGVTGYHAAQQYGKDAVVHEVNKLDKRPAPGQSVTIRYKDGHAQIISRAATKEKQLER